MIVIVLMSTCLMTFGIKMTKNRKGVINVFFYNIV